jgi:hypothetical protein
MSDKPPSLLARPTTWTVLYRAFVVALLACIAATLLVGELNVSEVNVGTVGYVYSVADVFHMHDVKNAVKVESGLIPLEVQVENAFPLEVQTVR